MPPVSFAKPPEMLVIVQPQHSHDFWQFGFIQKAFFSHSPFFAQSGHCWSSVSTHPVEAVEFEAISGFFCESFVVFVQLLSTFGLQSLAFVPSKIN